MRRLLSLLKRLAGDNRAASAVEYGLILAMIVLAMFAGLQSAGTSTSSMWNNISNRVQAAH